MTPTQASADGLREKIATFDDFLNEPQRSDGTESADVREYRHAAYKHWRPALDAILSAIGAEGVAPVEDVETRFDDPLEDACDKLLNYAINFFYTGRKHGQHGAVRWVQGEDGELVIFTRGEYLNVLMKNIHDTGNDRLEFPDRAGHHAALQRIGTALGLPADADLHVECVTAIQAKDERISSLEARAESAEFWHGVYPDGWTAERVVNEMHDFRMLMTGLPELYMHITGGQCSIESTSKSVVTALHDDFVTELVAEETADLRQQLAALQADYDALVKESEAQRVAGMREAAETCDAVRADGGSDIKKHEDNHADGFTDGCNESMWAINALADTIEQEGR